MENLYARYQQWLSELATTVNLAKQHQVAQLFNLNEVIKAYWNAGTALSAYETMLFIETFWRQSDEEVMPSLWPETLWYELSLLTDKTQIEWQELKSEFARKGQYQTGDYVGMGLFICNSCAESVAYYHPSTLSECLACGGREFHRQGIPS